MESPIQVPAAPSFYRPELDIIRFGAFLMVFMYHALPHDLAFFGKYLPEWSTPIAAAFVLSLRRGVDLFFMLSAYLITALLIREKARTGTIRVGHFFLRRILRIWPLYIVFSFLAILLWKWGRWAELPAIHQWGVGTFTENFVMFSHGMVKNPTIVLWSVAVEEQFYLVWPAIFLLFGIARIPMLAVGAILFSSIYRVHQSGLGMTEVAVWFSTFAHVDSICIGAALAVIGPQKPLSKLTFIIGAPTAFAIAVLADLNPETSWNVGYLAASLCWVLVIQGAALVTVNNSPVNKCLIYLGKISFGLYVFHMACLWIAEWTIPRLFQSVPVALLGTVVVSAISYHGLEMPFLKLKERFAVVKSRAV